MIQFSQDRRIFANSRKKALARNVLPEIKYSPTISRKLNDQLLLNCGGQSRLLYNYCPLSNILISKKISPANPEQSTLLVSKKRPTPSLNLHNFKIRKESVKKVTDCQKETEEEIVDKRNTTSLSHRSQVPSKQYFMEDETLKLCRTSNEPTFLVVRGNNNEELVRQILLARGIWREQKAGEGVPNFKWVFFKDRHNYKKMWSYTKTRVINHFQFNQEISTKDQLLRNLQLYCETKKIEVFSITPLTFILDFDDEYCEYNLKQFISFFVKNDPRKNKKTQSTNIVGKVQGYMAWQNSQVKKKVNTLSKPHNASTYYSQNSYLWLLKPTGLNRGRGICIFDTLEQLEKMLLDYLQQMNRKKIVRADKNQKNQKDKDKSKDKDKQKAKEVQKGKEIDKDEEKDKEKDKDKDKQRVSGQQSPIQNRVSQQLIEPQSGDCRFACEKFKLNACSFVIQKYVQRPLLLNSRKFDIRVWVFLTEQLDVYFFKQGYIRTSAQLFSTQDIDNLFIHLTNNAVQKYNPNYGQFEAGNQLSFRGLKDYLTSEQVDVMWARMKEVSFMTFSSVKRKINPNQRKHCFELFGLDFIIDAQHKVWLIEVNENPCIECSSPLLQQLIPRMLNDAFKLALDPLFEKKPEEKAYPVDGYPDSANLWEHLGRMTPNGEYHKK